MNRRAHTREGAAAADVGDRGVDFLVSRVSVLPEQPGHRHDHAGLTVAALRDLVRDPSLLHPVEGSSLGKPLDRRHGAVGRR